MHGFLNPENKPVPSWVLAFPIPAGSRAVLAGTAAEIPEHAPVVLFAGSVLPPPTDDTDALVALIQSADAGALRSRWAAQGFRVETFLPLPSAEHPKYMLPLEDAIVRRAAVGMLFDPKHPQVSRVLRFVASLIPPVVWRRTRRWRLFYARHPDRAPDWRDRLCDDPLWHARVGTDPVFAVEQGTHTVVVRVYAAGSASPAAVIKAAREVRDNPQIEREFLALTGLAQPGSGIPYPVSRDETDGLCWLVMPFMPGESLRMKWVRLHGRTDRRAMALRSGWFDQAAGWLLDLQRRTAGVPADAATRAHRHRLLISEEQVRLTERLSSGAIPFTAQHGDFQPANILFDGPAVHVIDWEWGDPCGLPLIDLFNLVFECHRLCASLGRRRGGLPDREMVQAAFSRDGLECRRLRYWTPRFVEALKLPDGAVDDLFYCWLRHKLREPLSRPDLEALIQLL